MKQDTTLYPVSISGSAYEMGVEKRFNVKPVSTRKRGYGYQVKYELSVPDLKKLADLLAVLACDASDQGKESVMEAIYKDLDRFPEEANAR